jgi:hypothetical protein
VKLSEKIIAVLLFSITMAYLESAIVVYLRLLYYPEGFNFPIKIIPNTIFLIEIGREFATIIMLVTIGFLTGFKFAERFSFFLFSFGVWDIFYYLWLKFFINWPASFLTDDLLFLIPVPWISPVAAPIIVSIIFIVISLIVLIYHTRGKRFGTNWYAKTLIVAGVALILFSFIWNFQNRLNMSSPVEFLWGIFGLGIFLIVSGFVILIRTSYYQQATKP